MTLFCVSRTGIEDTPSLCMSSRAVAKGLSPLSAVSLVPGVSKQYSLDGQNLLLPYIQVLEKLWVQLVYDREAGPIFPKERD